MMGIGFQCISSSNIWAITRLSRDPMRGALDRCRFCGQLAGVVALRLLDLFWIAPATSTGPFTILAVVALSGRRPWLFSWTVRELRGQGKRWQTQPLERIPNILLPHAGPDEFPNILYVLIFRISQSDQNTSLLPEQGHKIAYFRDHFVMAHRVFRRSSHRSTSSSICVPSISVISTFARA